MTAAEVHQLLGSPRWESCALFQEFWMYQMKSILAAGVVVFDSG